MRDLITMLDDLKQRRVKFRSLTEAIDTETPTGRALWQMIGVLAELERSLISERTRVSTQDQKPDLQLKALKKAGCQKIFREKVSGFKRQRPEFQRMLDQIRPGDVSLLPDWH